jgi:hypothetical protein
MKTLPRNYEWMLFLVFCVLIVTACSSPSPRQEQTLEQRAFGTYGTFVAAQQAAVVIVGDPSVPEYIKGHIRELNAVAKPAADLLQETAVQVSALRAADNKVALEAALAGLAAALDDARPKIIALVKAIRDYRNGTDPSRHTP